MKVVLLLAGIFCFATSFAQSTDNAATVTISAGGMGGNVYDVPSGTLLNKYGLEQISTHRSTGEISINVAEGMNAKFRMINTYAPDGTRVDNQYLLNMTVLQMSLFKNSHGQIYLGLHVDDYNLSNHLVFFKVDGLTVPMQNGQANIHDHVTLYENSFAVIPVTGISGHIEKKVSNDFKLKGFAAVEFSPFAFLGMENELLSNSSSVSWNYNPSLNEASTASGVRLVVTGTAQYKGKMCLIVRLEQNAMMGWAKTKMNVLDRKFSGTFQYAITPRVKAMARVENNELSLENNGRISISVPNTVSGGVVLRVGK